MRRLVSRIPILLLAVTLAGCSPGAVEQGLDLALGLLGAEAEEVEAPADGSSLGPESATRLYYQFVDQGGRVRFVERLAEVPEEWRERVGFVEMAVAPPLTPADARRARQGSVRAPRFVAKVSGPVPVIFYSAKWCGWCRKAKAHMDGEDIAYDLRDIDTPSVLQDLVQKTGHKGIPAFDVDGRILTGFDPDGLERLLASR